MLSRRAFLCTPAVSVFLGQEHEPGMFADADKYERFMGRWSRLVAPRFLDFSGLPARGRILDVGSGTGSLSFAIAERDAGAHVLGIDPSKEYVAYASSRNPSPDRASFEIGDAQQLRLPDAGFDAALSLLVFNFIPDPGKALSEVRRVVRPGGRISAAVWDYGAGMRMLRAFWDAVITNDPAADRLDEKHMPLCRQGELSALWRKGALENVGEEPIEIAMHFASFSDYWDPFLNGQGPAGAYVRGLSEPKVLALRDEVKRRLPLSADNVPFVLSARVWAVRGTAPVGRTAPGAR